MIARRFTHIRNDRKWGETNYVRPVEVTYDLSKSDVVSRLTEALGAGVEGVTGTDVAGAERGIVNEHTLAKCFTADELAEARGDDELSDGDFAKAGDESLADYGGVILQVIDNRARPYEFRNVIVYGETLGSVRDKIQKCVEAGELPPDALPLFDTGRLGFSELRKALPEHGRVIDYADEDEADDRLGEGSGPASTSREGGRLGEGEPMTVVEDADAGSDGQTDVSRERDRAVQLRDGEPVLNAGWPDVPETTRLLGKVSPRSDVRCGACGTRVAGLTLVSGSRNKARCSQCSSLVAVPPSQIVPPEPATRRSGTTIKESLAKSRGGERDEWGVFYANIAALERAVEDFRKSRASAGARDAEPRHLLAQMGLA